MGQDDRSAGATGVGAAAPAAGPAPLTWSVLARRLGPAGPLAVVAAVMPALGGIALLVFIGEIGAWLRGHETAGLALYTAGFVLLAGLALLPTYAQSVLGGWAFGFAAGWPAALAGFIGGSLVGYEIGRRASGDRAESIIDERPRWRAVRDALVGSGFFRTLLIIALLRAPPNSPFAMGNIVMASVKTGRAAFVVGTLLGMAPRTAAAVFIGSTIQSSLTRESIKSAGGWWVPALSIAGTVVVLAVVGVIAHRAIERVTGERVTGERTAGNRGTGGRDDGGGAAAGR